MTIPPAQPLPASAAVQPTIRLPMWKLSACLLAAPKAVLLLGLLVALVLGGDLWDDRLKAEFWGGVVLYTGTVAGLGFLWLFGPRPIFSWGAIVIAGSVIRMTISLAAAMAIYVLVHPERTFFWTVFLVASLAILATETAVIRSALAARFSLARAAVGPTSESRAA